MNKLIMNLQLFSELDTDDFDLGFDEGEVEVETEIPTEETITETTENEEVENEVPNEETQEQTEAFLKIKYNKEEKALSMQEAIELSQKGMNYDKVIDRLHQVENNVGLQYLNELAQRNGSTIDEMVAYWREQEYQSQVNELVQQNIPEEYAREMIENKKFREEYQQRVQAEQQQAKQKAEFDEFLNAFPNVKPNDIPSEVWQSNDNGVPLKYAYMEYQMYNIINENKVLKQQSKNKQSSPAMGTTMYGNKENTSKDDFMDGFNSI